MVTQEEINEIVQTIAPVHSTSDTGLWLVTKDQAKELLSEIGEREARLKPIKDKINDDISAYFSKDPQSRILGGKDLEAYKTPVGIVTQRAPLDITSFLYPLSLPVQAIEELYSLFKFAGSEPKPGDDVLKKISDIADEARAYVDGKEKAEAIMEAGLERDRMKHNEELRKWTPIELTYEENGKKGKIQVLPGLGYSPWVHYNLGGVASGEEGTTTTEETALGGIGGGYVPFKSYEKIINRIFENEGHISDLERERDRYITEMSAIRNATKSKGG